MKFDEKKRLCRFIFKNLNQITIVIEKVKEYGQLKKKLKACFKGNIVLCIFY
jgi:hypothetical protein